MNPTSKIFQKELDNIVSKASIDDVSSLRKIKIEGETDEATSSGSSGQFSAPLFSLFSDEAPKKKKIKGGVVETDESIEDLEENLEVIFELLDDFTSGGKLYYDDETESIWMINPETKEWIFEFEKSGTLWYSYPIFANIFKWLSIEYPDFNPYITKWVERILQKEVKDTESAIHSASFRVERILQKEVKDTRSDLGAQHGTVERILQKEVKDTRDVFYGYVAHVERILQKEVKDTVPEFLPAQYAVERILQKEVKDTSPLTWKKPVPVERILQNEVKNIRILRRNPDVEVERIFQKRNELNPEENLNESIEDSEENLEVIFELIDDFTSGGKLYYDDETETIWMINPETKQWIFEFEKSGDLWYSYPIFANIFKWISMEYPDFNPYITKWVERILQTKVKNTSRVYGPAVAPVERILQTKVKNTSSDFNRLRPPVERIFQKRNELNPEENLNESIEDSEENLEVIFELLDDFTSGGKLYYDDETESIWMINPETKEWIFEFEKSGTLWYSYPIFTNIFKWISMEYPDFNPYITKWVERILQKEVKNINRTWSPSIPAVERIIQKEVKNIYFSRWANHTQVERILQKNDEQLIGGKSDKMSLEDIAKKHNKKIGQLKKQFNMGLRIEKEHTNDEETAKEITLDHLYEDPEYYTKLNKMEKGEFKEATGAASAGQYSGPSFLAKSQSKKDWRGAAKPLYKGGKFVRVKKKCKTFPYCNQGDVKALDLWEDDKLTETIKKIAKNKRIHENVVRAIILHEIEEKLFGD